MVSDYLMHKINCGCLHVLELVKKYYGYVATVYVQYSKICSYNQGTHIENNTLVVIWLHS